MYNLAIQAEKIYRKPYIPILEENNVREVYFSYSEFVAFRNALRDYLKPVLTFAYSTGWRKQEILNLKWNQVDLNARTVRLASGTTKNKKGRLIILDGELLETIQAQWERRTVAEIPGHSPTLICPYVFHRMTSRSRIIARRGTRRASRPDCRTRLSMTVGEPHPGTW